MFNQQVLILYAIALSPFPLAYIGIKTFEWLQRNLFYDNQNRDNERIGREGLMIQLEEVRKQRDEIASQLMAVRLETEYIRLGNANLVDIEKAKTEKDIIDKFKDVKMTEFKPISRVNLLKACHEFVKDFELDHVLNGEIVDNPSKITVNHYNNLKSILK